MASNQCIKLPSTSAVSKVFGVTELLQNIINHLAPKDLTALQRINKTWQFVILTLTNYDEVMCFKSASLYAGGTEKWRRTIFGLCFEAPNLSRASSASEFLNLLETNSYTLNPMFSRYFVPRPGSRRAPFTFLPQRQVTQQARSKLYKMYLTQPPTTKVEVRTEKNGHKIIVTEFITRKSGVTLGDLATFVPRQISPFQWPQSAGGDMTTAGQKLSLQSSSDNHAAVSPDMYRIWLACQDVELKHDVESGERLVSGYSWKEVDA